MTAHATNAAVQSVTTLFNERMYTFLDAKMPAKRTARVITALLGCR